MGSMIHDNITSEVGDSQTYFIRKTVSYCSFIIMTGLPIIPSSALDQALRLYEMDSNIDDTIDFFVNDNNVLVYFPLPLKAPATLEESKTRGSECMC